MIAKTMGKVGQRALDAAADLIDDIVDAPVRDHSRRVTSADLPSDGIVYMYVDKGTAEGYLSSGIRPIVAMFTFLPRVFTTADLAREQAGPTHDGTLLAIDTALCPDFDHWFCDERAPEKITVWSPIPAAAVSEFQPGNNLDAPGMRF